MSVYRLRIKEAVFSRLEWGTLRDKMKALVDLGVVLLDVDFVEDPKPEPPPPAPEIRIERVKVYVCPWVKCHRTFHTRASIVRHYARVHKVERIEVKR